MDFGDILMEWEKSGQQTQKKKNDTKTTHTAKTPQRTKSENSKKQVNAMTDHHGRDDKTVLAESHAEDIVGLERGDDDMDFGDILMAWEKSEQQAHKKKGTVKTTGTEKTPQRTQAEDATKRVNPMTEWMRRHGTVDKDALAESHAESKKMCSHTSIKNLPIDARIDLHSFTQEEAWVHLDGFIANCKRSGLRKVLIVHGKGNHSQDNPVLGNMVRSFIEAHKNLGASGHPDAAGGGRGATWVLIKSSQFN